MILPPSPLPLTSAILIPFTSANFFAKGEALILPFEVTTGSLATATSAFLGSGAGAGTVSSVDALDGALLPPDFCAFNKVCQSASLSPTTAIGPSTCTASPA